MLSGVAATAGIQANSKTAVRCSKTPDRVVTNLLYEQRKALFGPASLCIANRHETRRDAYIRSFPIGPKMRSGTQAEIKPAVLVIGIGFAPIVESPVECKSCRARCPPVRRHEA